MLCKKLMILFVATLPWTSCRTPDESGNGAALKWGHLEENTLLATSPQFLINKSPGQSFRICLAKYMVDGFPGVSQEVESAVGLWSSYLGRRIPVAIDIKNLPRATASDTLDSLAKSYFAGCGEGYDVVVGFGPLSAQTVGLTGVYYSTLSQPDGSTKIVSFNRYLFLRDLDVTPDNTMGSNAIWKSFAQKIGTQLSTAQILPMMQRRSTRFYNTDNSLLTLAVLTHEIGHIWGLCDQYEGSTNCDPHHSTSHFELDSVMGAARFRQIAYLTDDDIAGIRALDARPGFKHEWPVTSALTATPPSISLPVVEFFKINSLSRKDGNLVGNYSLVTHGPSKLTISLIPSDGTPEVFLDGDTLSPEDGFYQPSIDLAIPLGINSIKSYNMRGRVFTKDTGGNWQLQKEFVTTSPK